MGPVLGWRRSLDGRGWMFARPASYGYEYSILGSVILLCSVDKRGHEVSFDEIPHDSILAFVGGLTLSGLNTTFPDIIGFRHPVILMYALGDAICDA